jgi:hypothetical protein
MWIKRIFASFGRGTHDQEILEEIESHIEMHTQDNLRAGMSPTTARRDALMSLGGLLQTVERCRELRSFSWLDRIVDSIIEFGADEGRMTSRSDVRPPEETVRPTR